MKCLNEYILFRIREEGRSCASRSLFKALSLFWGSVQLCNQVSFPLLEVDGCASQGLKVKAVINRGTPSPIVLSLDVSTADTKQYDLSTASNGIRCTILDVWYKFYALLWLPLLHGVRSNLCEAGHAWNMAEYIRMACYHQMQSGQKQDNQSHNNQSIEEGSTSKVCIHKRRTMRMHAFVSRPPCCFKREE